MSELKQLDKVFCHAYDINPLVIDISAASWTDLMKEDFADTARAVECDFKDFHSPAETVLCTDLQTGKSVSVKRDSLILVAKDLDMKKPMVLTDIDGVLTKFDKPTNSTYLEDGSLSQYTNLIESVDAKPTYIFNIISGIHKSAAIGVLTARGESQRVPTHLFIDKHIVTDYMLFMRGFGSNRISAESLKVRMIQSCILPYYDVVCFIEDTVKNVEKVKRILPDINTMLIKH